MNQHEFDELDAIVVHLLTKDRQHAWCSGLPYDSARWKDSNKPRKFCVACFNLVSRSMRNGIPELPSFSERDDNSINKEVDIPL